MCHGFQCQTLGHKVGHLARVVGGRVGVGGRHVDLAQHTLDVRAHGRSDVDRVGVGWHGRGAVQRLEHGAALLLGLDKRCQSLGDADEHVLPQLEEVDLAGLLLQQVDVVGYPAKQRPLESGGQTLVEELVREPPGAPGQRPAKEKHATQDEGEVSRPVGFHAFVVGRLSLEKVIHDLFADAGWVSCDASGQHAGHGQTHFGRGRHIVIEGVKHPRDHTDLLVREHGLACARVDGDAK
ncbi:hypothetical protein [Cyprinid herpesvirus 2]|nr:hypothetical protein [Cyprinid herpesvirus 2]